MFSKTSIWKFTVTCSTGQCWHKDTRYQTSNATKIPWRYSVRVFCHVKKSSCCISFSHKITDCSTARAVTAESRTRWETAFSKTMAGISSSDIWRNKPSFFSKPTFSPNPLAHNSHTTAHSPQRGPLGKLYSVREAYVVRFHKYNRCKYPLPAAHNIAACVSRA